MYSTAIHRRAIWPNPLLVLGALAFFLTTSSYGQDATKELEGWGQIIDPDGDCEFSAEGRQATIAVPATPHDLSAELKRMNAPRIIRSIEGDFTLAVMVNGVFEPGKANIPGRTVYNGAGLLVMQDDKNYIRLERAVLERGGQRQHYVNFELRVDGRVQRIGVPADMKLDPQASCLLRIERVGGEFRGIVRQGTRAWTELVPKEINFADSLSVGVAAINASDKPFEASYSGIVVKAK